MIRIEASAICSHGICEGRPADACGNTGSGSLGTVVVCEASAEGSMRVSSVLSVKKGGDSSTGVRCTGSDTVWSTDSTSSVTEDVDRTASSLAV